MTTLTDFYLTDVFLDDDYAVTEGGDLADVSGIDNLKAALTRRYITPKGALAHRPEYGAGLKDFMGSVSSLKTKQEITNRIEEQSARDPRVEKLLGVGFEIDDETPQKTRINVRIKPIGRGEITFTLYPFGEV